MDLGNSGYLEKQDRQSVSNTKAVRQSIIFPSTSAIFEFQTSEVSRDRTTLFCLKVAKKAPGIRLVCDVVM